MIAIRAATPADHSEARTLSRTVIPLSTSSADSDSSMGRPSVSDRMRGTSASAATAQIVAATEAARTAR